MKYRFLFYLSAALCAFFIFSGGSFAATIETAQAAGDRETCGFDVPENKAYDAELIAVRRKLHVETDEIFRVKVFVRNNGNMPWFSNESACPGPRMSLGSDVPRDRNSSLYADTLSGVSDTNWEAQNRIGMDQLRVDPGEIASFTFYSQAPSDPDVIKEYFTPVLTAIQWLDNAEFSFETVVGGIQEDVSALRTKLLYANESGSVLDINLNGQKSILIDLSSQQMFLKLDDRVIRQFPVSTGKASTPTPTGNTKIILKQEVRVGGESPHYIMPKFMMFRAGGYGIHALPSLGHDGGWFWTEARNHIGIPVSHGCIRLLPEDADFAFEFGEVGMPVTVQR
ncbi:MAG: L,D-transpeptidase [Candidatus Peregrinibacteria bacterium]